MERTDTKEREPKMANHDTDDIYTDTIDIEKMEPVKRLTRDLKAAAATLSDREARFLVDTYYIMQENRKRGRNQERALSETEEPNELISFFGDQAETMERQIERALDVYSYNHLTGRWLRDIYGVGPVLSAGFQAFIHMGNWCEVCHSRTKERCEDRQKKKDKNYPHPPHPYTEIFACPTVGHIWAYAGIAGDGQKKWEKGQKRPWNATLKTLCWKFGDVQVKFHNREECYYGKIYQERKDLEVKKNEGGYLKHIADERLARPRASKEEHYHKKGILSPGHIDLRARRYATKRFLIDLHTVWYWLKFGRLTPVPYPLDYLADQHIHYYAPLNTLPHLKHAIRRRYGKNVKWPPEVRP